MIITRYLFKEVLIATLTVTAILLLLFLSHQFVRFWGYVAEGRLAFSLFIRLVPLLIPQLLGLLLPLSFYVGILIAYGRLHAESEMVVMAACGVGPEKQLKVVSVLGLMIMAISGIFTIWLEPHINTYREHMFIQAETTAVLQTILPGHFQSLAGGRRVVYVEKISRDRLQMHHIFVAERTAVPGQAGFSWDVLSAQRGYQEIRGDNQERFIVARGGYRYRGVAGENDYRIIEFNKYGIRLPERPLLEKKAENALSTGKLWRERATLGTKALAELQWRLSIPFSTLLLGFLAFTMSEVRPREGRFANFLPAILMYIIYANFLFVGRAWVENGKLSSVLGMGWIHLGLVIVISILFLHKRGWLRGFFSWIP